MTDSVPPGGAVAAASAPRPFRLRDLWRSLPGDLIGRFVMAGCGIATPTGEYDAGDVRAVLVEDPRVARWFRAHAIPVQAQTLGRYVFSRGPMSPVILAHEVEHIRQWERFGPFYLLFYFCSSALALARGRRPYWDNAFEVAARRRSEESESGASRASAAGDGDETRPKT